MDRRKEEKVIKYHGHIRSVLRSERNCKVLWSLSSVLYTKLLASDTAISTGRGGEGGGETEGRDIRLECGLRSRDRRTYGLWYMGEMQLYLAANFVLLVPYRGSSVFTL